MNFRSEIIEKTNMEAPIQLLPAQLPHLGSKPQDGFNETEGVYLLPHHQDEIERLQRQHFFIKAATDDKLIPIDLPTGARVLDSGCADGELNQPSKSD